MFEINEKLTANAYQLFYFQMLLSNLTGVQFAAGGAGGFVPVMPLYGNPGDYAWGRGGLDAVVTSLLNQMEGAGPPPMPTDNIGEIPQVKITSSQVGKLKTVEICKGRRYKQSQPSFDHPVREISITSIIFWTVISSTKLLLSVNDGLQVVIF